jgi:GNAT superfamily N-acetyltransferase
MELRVRRAVVGDARQIATIHVETWRAAYGHVFPADFLAELSIDARTDRWTQTLSESVNGVFVGEVDGRIRGFASAGGGEDEDADAPQGELYAIYVHPTAWGMGLGRTLLARAEEWLHLAGFADAGLWVLEDNPRARRLYEAAGWFADGARQPFSRGGVETVVIRYRKRLR